MMAETIQTHRFRVVSYNTHKSRGLDGRVRPDRIVQVLREIDADIVALQEVLSIPNESKEKDQAKYFCDELAFHTHCIGQTRKLKGGVYGNVILSRMPLHFVKNYDISVSWREQRGCLRADLEFQPSRLLHIFNIHLGTDFFERRRQARKLIDAAILHNDELKGARIVLGDFNEWTHGLASRMLARHFVRADLQTAVKRSKTFPVFLPVLSLDSIYFDAALSLERFRVYRSKTALMASDHLPIVADLKFHAPAVI